jgi:site-specific DNA-methyltransferase (adenine-specific)
MSGLLYFGDNLEVLREHVASASVDLVYLDPPFNSKRDYNVLFQERDASASEAQIRAFEDCWHWDVGAEKTYRALTGADAQEHGVSEKLVELMESLRRFLGQNDMLAYLVMMAARLVELYRVLKPTGSLYLHCDPTASHYLKLVLDAVFGQEGFANEIIWQRTTAKSLMTRRLPNSHDVVFSYRKDDHGTWNLEATFQPYDPDNLDEKTESKYSLRDPDGRRYTLGDITNPNPDRPNLKYEFLGHTKVWRWTRERMLQAYNAGLVIQPSEGAVPREKRYLDERLGKPLGDVWTDIPPLNSQAQERLGYPTQKPLALMERILSAASNEGDIVLDPFCGCGTTIHAAQRLKRNWIGIDITHLAIALIRTRLDDGFPGAEYEVRGEPVDVASAQALAAADPYQFQWWALHLIGARPVGDVVGKVGKKGKDRGIDGVIRFRDDPAAETSERVLVSVKAGHSLNPGMVRDLRGTIDREEAPIGVLFLMHEPTAEMRSEAARAGTWRSKTWNREYPRIQIITVEQAFDGIRVQYSGQDVTLRPTRTDRQPQQVLPLFQNLPRAHAPAHVAMKRVKSQTPAPLIAAERVAARAVRARKRRG